MSVKQSDQVKPKDVAEILRAMAELMTDLRQQDLALQDALSSISARARLVPEMGCLQHVDLVTQTHDDLASLLVILSDALDGESVNSDELKRSLSLRSLQDSLIDRDASAQNVAPGDLALF